jgi:hypothetical protein
MVHHAPPPLWSIQCRPPTLTLFTLRVQTVAESVAEATPSTPVCRLHVIDGDTTLIPRALSIVELRHHAKVRH